MLKTLVLLAALFPLAASAAGSAKQAPAKSRMIAAAHQTKKGGNHPASPPTDPKKVAVEAKQQSFDSIEIDEGG